MARGSRWCSKTFSFFEFVFVGGGGLSGPGYLGLRDARHKGASAGTCYISMNPQPLLFNSVFGRPSTPLAARVQIVPHGKQKRARVILERVTRVYMGSGHDVIVVLSSV